MRHITPGVDPIFPRARLRAVVVAVALSATISACKHAAVESVATEEDVPVAVQAAAVVDSLESVISATGVVAPASGADWTITAPEAARIAELPKAEGDHVQPGDLLVRFEIPSMAAEVTAREADVGQADARVAAAKAARTRTAGLVERGIAAQKDLEAAELEQAQAEAAVKQAQAGVGAAKALIDRTMVRARFAGVIAKRWHGVGDLVEAAGTVIRVIDPSRLEVVTSVAVGDLPHVVVGHAARIGGPASDATEPGIVVSTPAAVDPASATAEVRVRFSSATKLATGTPVTVSIVGDRVQKVIAIPTAGVIRDGGEVYVMVAGQDDDKAHKTPVVLGLSSGDKVEVKKGINAGDLIIVRGQEGLPDEAGITIVK
jgi:RND family efflux transporter MFP subunit